MEDHLSEPIESHDEDLFASPPPAWPKWIGGLAIAWGGLGLTCVGLGGLGLAFQGKLVEPALEGAPLPDALVATGLDWALLGISLLITFVLLFGGIFCVMRSPVGRKLILIWAIVSIPTALWSYSIQSGKQASLIEWAKTYPDTQYAQQVQMSTGAVGQAIGLGLTIIFGVLVPGFFILWFGFIKTKPEQMTGTEDGVV